VTSRVGFAWQRLRPGRRPRPASRARAVPSRVRRVAPRVAARRGVI